MRYILTDIEGTTTSTAFVYETLFPYFKQNIAHFLSDNHNHDSLSQHINAVQQTSLEESGAELDMDGLAQQLVTWTEEDRKHTALKAIQGILWRAAYLKGEIQGHLYPDVPPALARWHQLGLRIGIYSSGSVDAQRLLFKYSIFGDLTPVLSDYFDTNIGHKREAASYRAIAHSLQLPPQEILFLSDVSAELDAASSVGMQTIQLIRPGTKAAKNHRLAADFNTLLLES